MRQRYEDEKRDQKFIYIYIYIYMTLLLDPFMTEPLKYGFLEITE